MRRFWGFKPWRRHSLILAVAGFLYSLVGFLYAASPANPGRRRSLSFLLDIAPQQFWGGLFITVGVLTVLSSVWPPIAENWGYTLLTGLSAGWSAVYLMGVLFFHSPAATNGTQAVLWGTLAFMWWAISGLVNPDTVVVIEDDSN